LPIARWYGRHVTSVTPSGTSASVPSQAVPTRQRRNISTLLPRQLADLREGFRKMQRLGDDRGYQFHAGIHGLPLPKYCKIAHGQGLFLAWHRAYLAVFEEALRKQSPNATLPWWDWTKVPRIPRAFDEREGADGNTNPLFSVRINLLARQQARTDPEERLDHELAEFPDTFRQPGRPGTRPLPTKAAVDAALASGDFDDFQFQLEQLHNDVHVWVGGHMGDIPFAAYDPIFWAHHTMIDRIWRIWQRDHSTAPMSNLDTQLPPFGVTVRRVVNVTSLGYDYAVSTTHDPGRP
jgi:tyrosinase